MLLSVKIHKSSKLPFCIMLDYKKCRVKVLPIRFYLKGHTIEVKNYIMENYIMEIEESNSSYDTTAEFNNCFIIHSK